MMLSQTRLMAGSFFAIASILPSDSGSNTAILSFLKKGTATEKGTQIDLLLDRNDRIINIFEMKFYNDTFSISKDYAQNLKSKMRVFKDTTKTPKHLFLTLVTTFGLVHNEYSVGLVDQILTLDALFLD